MAKLNADNRRLLGLSLITFTFGGLLGFLIAAGNGITLDGHDHATGHHGHHGTADHSANDAAQHGAKGHGADHDKPLHLDGGQVVPALTIALHRDPVSGYNLQVLTKDFDFVPAQAGARHVDGEGHAHLYIDGKKLARLYGEWFHIAALPAEAKMLKVTLNSHDHRPLYADGAALAKMIDLSAID